MIERTDLHCYACNQYFGVELDMSLNGNHEISCAHCGHIHYRVVRDGRVTGERYRSSAGATYYANTTTNTYITASTGGSTQTSNMYTWTGAQWANMGTGGTL